MTFDVLIVGGGPAAAFLSIKLRQAGLEVGLVFRSESHKLRPIEIISPSTILSLDMIKNHSSIPNGASCTGILSAWLSDEIDSYDYELTGCSPGVAFDRNDLHTLLVDVSQSLGVNLFRNTTIQKIELDNKYRKKVFFSDPTQPAITTKFLVDASGRSSSLTKPKGVRRIKHDSLIGISTEVVNRNHSSWMILESSENGWWYLSPNVKGAATLSYMTDADILPKSPKNRSEWLTLTYRNTLLIRDAIGGDGPDFEKTYGVDACVSNLNRTIGNNWAAIGDASLSLDPLSGTGIQNAAEAASTLSQAIFSKDSKIYSSWWAEKVQSELKTRYSFYKSAAHKYHNSDFWERRCNLKSDY